MPLYSKTAFSDRFDSQEVERNVSYKNCKQAINSGVFIGNSQVNGFVSFFYDDRIYSIASFPKGLVCMRSGILN